MKIKTFLVALLLIFVLVGVGSSSVKAMTESERQALIIQLQGIIAQLQQQILEIIAQRQQQAVSNNTACYVFERDLLPGDADSAEVSRLQEALQQQGFSYGTDSVGVYGAGTTEAVRKFQVKYKIGVGTGLIGPLTRAKLNSFCNTASNSNCTPKWQSGPWTVCSNNQQSRIVTDINNCGITKNQPKTSQTCQTKAIDISVDSSDGPVDVFLSLGNGANTSADGIKLSSNVVLQWTGIDVSACTVSDNLNPSVFSGYQASSGSQTVNVSGILRSVSSTSKVSATFRINCVSTITGKTTSDSITVNLFYASNAACVPNWKTGTWSACVNGKQTRTALDSNYCGTTLNKPATTQTCSACVPKWDEGTWSACVGGKQTRTPIDLNNCGVSTGKPATSQSCCSATCLTQADGTYAINCNGTPTKCSVGYACEPTYNKKTVYVNGALSTTETLSGSRCYKPVCTPSWQEGTWSACINGRKTRTVTDANNCGVSTGKPVTTITCCSAACLNQADGIYAVSCSGNVTKCATGRVCELTYSTSYSLENGVAHTNQILSGSRCTCYPFWQAGDWSACVNGIQSRIVTDYNNCGVSTNKPAISQSCTH